MEQPVKHDELDTALRRCGANWNAAQAHGFLCSRLAVAGSAAEEDWLQQVAAGAATDSALREECVGLLGAVFRTTHRQLAERQSEFAPLLPDDASTTDVKADALAHWCEGFLHGLVSGPHPESLKARLATEPLSDIIKDLLQMTRAAAHVESGDEGEGEDDEEDEEAYTELVEYIRVAVQLAYEELAAFRSPAGSGNRKPGADVLH